MWSHHEFPLSFGWSLRILFQWSMLESSMSNENVRSRKSDRGDFLDLTFSISTPLTVSSRVVLGGGAITAPTLNN